MQIEDLDFGAGDAYCFCKPGFDVRCCCVPENPTWLFCRMRASTAYFIMGNDYDHKDFFIRHDDEIGLGSNINYNTYDDKCHNEIITHFERFVTLMRKIKLSKL